MTPELLPGYQVKARNTAQQSENAIHHDDVAQRYGFRGGLGPGVTVYAYLTEPLVAALGSAWLQRGTATVRFVKPLFDGEEFRVEGSIDSRGPGTASAPGPPSTAASASRPMSFASKPSGGNTFGVVTTGLRCSVRIADAALSWSWICAREALRSRVSALDWRRRA